MHPHQGEFNRIYITSSEICRRAGVSRNALYSARKRKNWPNPIVIEGCTVGLWPREEMEKLLKDTWKEKIDNNEGALE